MTRGQLVTILTLGFSLAVVAAGFALAGAVLLSPAVYAALAPPPGPSGPISPVWIAGVIAAGGTIAAFCLFQAQQAVAEWLARRDLARLRAAFKDVEMALGTEKANEFLAFKLQQIEADNKRGSVNLFAGNVARTG